MNLSDRELEILREVVELYLESGEPVASGTVARFSATGLSSPSIRNVMADLERKGYLGQPHTSAGRVPTDAGFRVFIDRLLQRPALDERQQRRLRGLIEPVGPLEEVLAQVSQVLARVTDEVGLAVAPPAQRAVLRSIHFVQVSARRVLAVMVTQGGLVESRLLKVEREYLQGELDRVSNYCTQNFTGQALGEIRQHVLRLMAEESARADQLLATAAELGQKAVAPEGPGGGEVFVQGTERLLEGMSPGQLEAVQRLLAAFADKALLLALLETYITASGPRVVVGSELALAGASGLGLITSSFELTSGERALIGVIGHKRMDYARIIPIVDFVGRFLEQEIGGGRGGTR